MEFLAVAARLHGLHDDVFGGHERQFGADVGGDDLRPHLKPVRDVREQRQDHVRGQERLADHDAAVRRIVQRALEPLHGLRERAVQRQADQVARQRADAFAAHRVALVRHRAGADLLLAERLLDLLHVREQPDVVRHLGRTLGDAGKDRQHAVVDLARVRLAAQAHRMLESHLRGDHAVELAHLVAVAAEEVQVARLRPGGALRAAERQFVDGAVERGQVEHEVLDVEGEALAERGELGGLEVREAEHRHGFVFGGELREVVDQVQQFRAQDLHAVAHLDQLGVVRHETARRAEVDDAFRLRADLAERADVAHHVGPHFRLDPLRLLEIDVVEVRAHFVQLFIGDRQSERLFALGEREPETPPGGVFPLGREIVAHFLACVTSGQGVLIGRVILHSANLSWGCARYFIIIEWIFTALNIHHFFRSSTARAIFPQFSPRFLPKRKRRTRFQSDPAHCCSPGVEQIPMERRRGFIT